MIFQIIEGKQNTILAVHGLGAAQVNAGYVCACQCYVKGPGWSHCFILLLLNHLPLYLF